MHPPRLAQLVGSVPSRISDDQRARPDAHVETVDGCRARIERVRADLRRALDGRGGGALDLACELDGLERVPQRVDGEPTAPVDELTRSRHCAHDDDGVPA